MRTATRKFQPPPTILRRIILAGGLFAVLASNEGSVECMPPERRPASAFPACCSQEEKALRLVNSKREPVTTLYGIPHRGTVRFYKTEIKLKPHTG